MSDGCVRLRISAVQLVRRQLRKDNRGCVRVGKLSRRGVFRGGRGRRVEAPLEKVDIGACLGGCLGFALLFCWFFLGLRARQRQDELGVLAGCGGNTLVCFDGDYRTDGVRV